VALKLQKSFIKFDDDLMMDAIYIEATKE